MKFGQAFFCATFLSDQLTEISKQIFVSQFGIYQKNLPAQMAQKYPRLYHVIKMDGTVQEDQCPYSRNAALKTKGGQWLMNYEKNKLSQSDLYANQVAEDLKKSLFVETWLNGDNPDWKNKCGDIFVKNIRAIHHTRDDVAWESKDDHSKWAISEQPGTVCIGDINRQKSQSGRGGGTLCIDNPKIWQFFRDSIQAVECGCPNEQNCQKSPKTNAMDVPAKERKVGDPRTKFPSDPNANFGGSKGKQPPSNSNKQQPKNGPNKLKKKNPNQKG